MCFGTDTLSEWAAGGPVDYEAVEGIVFDVQRYSLHDGPGLRTNVFFKGCPLRCGWCSNPESQQMQPEIAVFRANCIECGQFAELCPDVWQTHGKGPEKRALLPEFRERAAACPARGVRWIGRRRSAGSIMAEVARDVPFYGSSGGMTLTGGEPLLQPDLAEALLRLAKAAGIHTAVETTGSAPWPHVARCLPFLDTVLFDLKHVDPVIHRRYTGVDNALILENLRTLAGIGANLVIRIPLVPGFNASQESIEQLGSYIQELGLPSPRVDVLPYHVLGKSKYTALAREYPWEGHGTLTEAQVADLARLLVSFGPTVTVGG
jgi:pyruvate formate lyase activating enzyme